MKYRLLQIKSAVYVALEPYEMCCQAQRSYSMKKKNDVLILHQ